MKFSEAKNSKKFISALTEAIIVELGMGALETGVGAQRGGNWGSSSWSRGDVNVSGSTGEELYQQMRSTPSTRMLRMDNPGTPNDHLPGQELDNPDDESGGIGEPTDLSR